MDLTVETASRGFLGRAAQAGWAEAAGIRARLGELPSAGEGARGPRASPAQGAGPSSVRQAVGKVPAPVPEQSSAHGRRQQGTELPAVPSCPTAAWPGPARIAPQRPEQPAPPSRSPGRCFCPSLRSFSSLSNRREEENKSSNPTLQHSASPLPPQERESTAAEPQIALHVLRPRPGTEPAHTDGLHAQLHLQNLP